MEHLTITRHHGGGSAYGGQVVTDMIAFPVTWPVASISIVDVEGNGFLLSRDEALELADELWACAIDA